MDEPRTEDCKGDALRSDGEDGWNEERERNDEHRQKRRGTNEQERTRFQPVIQRQDILRAPMSGLSPDVHTTSRAVV